MLNIIKENLNGISVTLFTGGMSLYGFIEKATPVLAFIGLLVSITVGIATVINIRKKNRQLDKQDRIDDLILDSERKTN